MSELRPIEKDAIPRALSKAERYRLLNEPREAESICRDVLAIDPGNADAHVCLVLALTDLFEGLHVPATEVRPLLDRLKGEFERRYYAGIVDERWGKALLHAGYEHPVVYDFIRSAMAHYDAAQKVAPDTNDDATLRWNACVRMIELHKLAAPEPEGADEAADSFGDDVPVR